MKAIALISGGLDSILAARLIQEQAIEIIPLNFKIPFRHRDKKISDKNVSKISWVADNLGAQLRTVDISDAFLGLLVKPKHGFGANMNPCIDCKILMLCRAKDLMRQWHAAFVVTGEVLGQRPMSQHKQALKIIEKESGLEGLILRPLSAKLLPETLPEREGWVARKRLLDFGGRSRQPQIALAENFKIKDYPNAAGGCLLTDPVFSRRLKELITHEELTIDSIELLKVGRHFRISDKTRLVVGRDEKENRELENLARENDCLFMPAEDMAGPTALGRGEFDEELIKFACSITCRYCDLNGKTEAEVILKKGIHPGAGDRPSLCLKVSPLDEDKLVSIRI